MSSAHTAVSIRAFESNILANHTQTFGIANGPSGGALSGNLS